MLFLALFLVKDPEIISAGRLHVPPLWVAGAAGFIFGAARMVPLANLLGFDRGGVATWWRLPLLGAVHPLSLDQGSGLLLLLGTLFLWHAGSGLGKSLSAPRPMGLGTCGVQLDIDEEKLARIGLVLAPLVWMLPLYALGNRWGLRGFLAFLLPVALGSLLRLRRCLARACRDLALHREELTAALSGR